MEYTQEDCFNEVDRLQEIEKCYKSGVDFIQTLITKYENEKKILQKNMDTYDNSGNEVMFDQTFSNWNKLNLVIFDLKDTLCRMAIEVN